MTYEKDVDTINESLKKWAEHLNSQMKSNFLKQANEISAIIKETIFDPFEKFMLEKLQPTIEAIEKIQKNHKEGKEIRGEIITSIIDLEVLLELLIAKKYV